jgi:hypothetical protein
MTSATAYSAKAVSLLIQWAEKWRLKSVNREGREALLNWKAQYSWPPI